MNERRMKWQYEPRTLRPLRRYWRHFVSSKAAVSCITECLRAQLESEGTNLSASIFYPSGGLLNTGIWTTMGRQPPSGLTFSFL